MFIDGNSYLLHDTREPQLRRYKLPPVQVGQVLKFIVLIFRDVAVVNVKDFQCSNSLQMTNTSIRQQSAASNIQLFQELQLRQMGNTMVIELAITSVEFPQTVYVGYIRETDVF